MYQKCFYFLMILILWLLPLSCDNDGEEEIDYCAEYCKNKECVDKGTSVSYNNVVCECDSSCSGCADECKNYTCQIRSHATAKCHSDGHIHWIDSCGAMEEDVKRECQHGCDSTTNKCNPDPCIATCAERQCGTFNDCNCGTCFDCHNICNNNNGTCEAQSHTSYTCNTSDGHIHWMNNCRGIEDIKQECQYGCEARSIICNEEEDSEVVNVINGTIDEDGLFSEVVRLSYIDQSGSHSCTGVIIGSNIVLTAAHCICNEPSDLIGITNLNRHCIIDSSVISVRVYTEGNYGSPTQTITVSSSHIPDGFSLPLECEMEGDGRGCTIDGDVIDDIAVLVLEESINDITDYAILATESPTPGETDLTMAGFGRFECNRMSDGRRRFGVIEADWFSLIPEERQIRVSGTVQHSSGDSGGPLFTGNMPEAPREIVGIVSHSRLDCSWGDLMDISFYTDFIETVVENHPDCDQICDDMKCGNIDDCNCGSCTGCTNECNNGICEATSHVSYSCLFEDEHIHWTNRCGQFEEIKEECQYGCIEYNQTCNPDPNASCDSVCADKDCGSYGNCNCGSCTDCQSECNNGTCEPASHINYVCNSSDGHIYWTDSCETMEEDIKQECQHGCNSNTNECNSDPCTGITCNNPPDNTCIDSNAMRSYSSPGACTNGSYSYDHADTTCQHGCNNGACEDDPCIATCSEKQCGTFDGCNCGDCTGCASECNNGACEARSRTSYECRNRTEIWYRNSCGNWESRKEPCPNGCEDGARECNCYDTSYDKRCKSGTEELWEYNNCGDSRYVETCEHGCNINTNECKPCEDSTYNEEYSCSGNDRYGKNECGNTSYIETCQNGCNEATGECNPEPACTAIAHWRPAYRESTASTNEIGLQLEIKGECKQFCVNRVDIIN